MDQIAEHAEVSKATFFRYFSSKGEVIFTSEGYRLELLGDTIVGRPTAENDLVAATTPDTRRVGPHPRPAPHRATDPPPPRPLRCCVAMSFDLALQWQDVIGEALARRHGLAAPDPRCRLVANLVFVALSNTVNRWVQSGFRGEFGPLLDEAFALLTESVARSARAMSAAASGVGEGSANGGDEIANVALT